MHWFVWNIADYRKDTQHLNPIEHYIYRELMDWYYLDETPIPNDNPLVLRKLRLGQESDQDLMNVLNEFFEGGDPEWTHPRIEHELQVYQAKAEAARVNGRKGGRPKKAKRTKKVKSANPAKTLTSTQEPVPSNQNPPSIPQGGVPQSLAKRVIDTLNHISGRSFKHAKASIESINARICEGHTEADFTLVLEHQWRTWQNTSQQQYYRPSTLFRPSKFDGYLQEAKNPAISQVSRSTRDIPLLESLTDTSWAQDCVI